MLTIVNLVDFIDREIEQAKSCIDCATTEQWKDRNDGAVSALKALRQFIDTQSEVPGAVTRFVITKEGSTLEPDLTSSNGIQIHPSRMPPNCS